MERDYIARWGMSYSPRPHLEATENRGRRDRRLLKKEESAQRDREREVAAGQSNIAYRASEARNMCLAANCQYS